MKKFTKKIAILTCYYLSTSLMTMLIGRYLGFTPKRLNPIPWDVLYEKYWYFVFILPLFLVILGYVVDNYLDDKVKK